MAFGAVTIALVVAATILTRMQRGKTLSAAVRRLPVQIDVSLQAIHFTETRQGVKQWDLSADRAEYDKNRGRTSLSKVSFVIMNSPAGMIRLTADRAEYDNATKDVFLSGKVRGESGSGLTFSSEKVQFVASRQVIESQDKVRVTSAGLSVEGVGMQLQTHTHRLKLSRVEAEVQPGAATP